MKTIKKYQTGSEVKGSKGTKKMKKYQPGGMAVPVPGMKKNQAKAEEFYDKNPSVRTYTNEYTGKKIPTGPMTKGEYQNAAERAASAYKPITPMLKKGGAKMKTGGMVNSNTKVTALKVAGSKGVKSGVNTKVSASKVAKGRTGGTSSSPNTAIPKAQMGRIVGQGSCKMGKCPPGMKGEKSLGRAKSTFGKKKASWIK